jgi:transposase
MKGEAFLTYVKQCLAPTLERGDIVVMDNIPSHKVDGVQAIEAAGAALRYLPPHSADLNPIEAAYRACKAFAQMRRTHGTSTGSPHRSVRSALATRGMRQLLRSSALARLGDPTNDAADRV